VLVIRAEQMQVFERASRRRFEDEMVAHARVFAPPLCQVIGEDALRGAICSAIARAESYGFTNRGPIRLFIELTFLCGSAFDTDPQYPSAGQFLRGPGDQMYRAQQVHDWHNAYLEQVSGPGAINVHKALSETLTFSRLPLPIASENLTEGLLLEMKRIFPAKAAFVGDAGLTAIIDESIAEARLYGFEGVRSKVLLAVLKFAFGHGCTNDPLYPWIEQTLKDDRIAGPEARAARLEKKSITWLEHVVARNQRKSHS
jgi:hypothetical protein